MVSSFCLEDIRLLICIKSDNRLHNRPISDANDAGEIKSNERGQGFSVFSQQPILFQCMWGRHLWASLSNFL